MLYIHKKNTYDFKVKMAFDCGLAQLYLREWAENSYDNSYKMPLGRDNDYLVIFENEAMAKQPHYKKSHLTKMKKAELYTLLEGVNHPMIYTTNFSDITKVEIIECLLQIDNIDYYTNLYDAQYYHELPCSFSISGCSREGIKVQIVGKVEEWINEEFITNLYYNSPIYSNIEILHNGEIIEEFSLDELNDFNEYEYNKNAIIAMLSDFTKSKEYHSVFLEYLNEYLPEYLSDCIY